MERAKEAKPAPTREDNPGGRGKTADKVRGFGNTADYLTARIARDHPAILDRMKAGEFKSVRQAAIEANRRLNGGHNNDYNRNIISHSALSLILLTQSGE